MKSVIKRVLNGEWASLQQDIEQMAATKVKSKVDEKKFEVLAKLNGVDIAEQKKMMEASKVDKAAKSAAEAKKAKAEAELKKAKADKKAGKKVTKAQTDAISAKIEKAKKAIKDAKNTDKK